MWRSWKRSFAAKFEIQFTRLSRPLAGDDMQHGPARRARAHAREDRGNDGKNAGLCLRVNICNILSIDGGWWMHSRVAFGGQNTDIDYELYRQYQFFIVIRFEE
ncbi:hypothetical protein EFR84_27210 [Rhizobium chutanense]|uniref:Uncharacterized protein n=2 Tax=Rhizobium chutanense TaxID=2035448 RepID=A0A3S0S4D7_9HYPH|nr:hypothetical protein EFR84_27210 [Rhizobium chutanense]